MTFNNFQCAVKWQRALLLTKTYDVWLYFKLSCIKQKFCWHQHFMHHCQPPHPQLCKSGHGQLMALVYDNITGPL